MEGCTAMHVSFRVACHFHLYKGMNFNAYIQYNSSFLSWYVIMKSNSYIYNKSYDPIYKEQMLHFTFSCYMWIPLRKEWFYPVLLVLCETIKPAETSQSLKVISLWQKNLLTFLSRSHGLCENSADACDDVTVGWKGLRHSKVFGSFLGLILKTDECLTPQYHNICSSLE